MGLNFDDIIDERIGAEEPDLSDAIDTIRVDIIKDADVLNKAFMSYTAATKHKAIENEDYYYVKKDEIKLRFYSREIASHGQQAWGYLMHMTDDHTYKILTKCNLWFDGAALISHCFYISPQLGSCKALVNKLVGDNITNNEIFVFFDRIQKYMDVLKNHCQEEHYQQYAADNHVQYFDLQPHWRFNVDMRDDLIKFCKYCADYESNPLVPVKFDSVFCAAITECIFHELTFDKLDSICDELSELFDTCKFNYMDPDKFGKFIVNTLNNNK